MLMARALQLHGVRKRFVAGAGGCLASADVLRGIDLHIDSCESVAVVGGPASGKSTLLLCAAGLVRPDAGTALWYGDADAVSAATRTHYCFSLAELVSIGRSTEPRIFLLDLPTSFGMGVLGDWIEDQCESGSSVLVAAREERFIQRSVDRVVVLSGGVLHPARTIRARVAESVAGEAPFC
jgi:ABC-type polar amino acid transport system ATPase subunit